MSLSYGETKSSGKVVCVCAWISSSSLVSGVISGFVEGGRGKGQRAAGKEEKTTEGGVMQDERMHRRRTRESGREARTRGANEKGIRRTLSTSNRAGTESPKDSNTSTRWVQSKRASERECVVDDTYLGLFHGLHCEPFATFTFAEGRREDREDSLFLDLRSKRMG